MGLRVEPHTKFQQTWIHLVGSRPCKRWNHEWSISPRGQFETGHILRHRGRQSAPVRMTLRSIRFQTIRGDSTGAFSLKCPSIKIPQSMKAYGCAPVGCCVVLDGMNYGARHPESRRHTTRFSAVHFGRSSPSHLSDGKETFSGISETFFFLPVDSSPFHKGDDTNSKPPRGTTRHQDYFQRRRG